MALVTMRSMLRNACEGGYAVGYFESWDLDSLAAVIDAAEMARSPVIIGYNGSFLGHRNRMLPENVRRLGAVGRTMAELAEVPVALLLNEADDLSMIRLGIESGFNAVMYDDHGATFEQWIAINRALAEDAHAAGVDVEAEVGCLPTAGISGRPANGGHLTDPDQAVRFVEETGIDALAIAIGNIHLLERGKASLDFERIATLRKRVDVPLVLHGGTGISESDLKKAIGSGVGKVNFGTVLKRTYINVWKSFEDEHAVDDADPHEVLGKGGPMDVSIRARIALIDLVKKYMSVLGSSGKAAIHEDSPAGGSAGC